MNYPSLEKYNEALQNPAHALQDPQLKAGQLRTNGLGLPLALCGGFALTYTVDAGGKRFALRCFHKKSNDLERRYQAIALRLKKLANPYFLPFDFIPNGIRIEGNIYPIVKMEWAKGTTLAEFLERNHGNSAALNKLRQTLATLSEYLEEQQIAHGDIQPENLMVNADGSSVQLIDYDGMFVDSLRGSAATELGQANFQHPKRTASDFNEKLDRFSFITLDVALQALAVSPGLWKTSNSEPSAIVFRRNDFLDPGTSLVFNQIISLPGLKVPAQYLAQLADGPFDQVPTHANFRAQLGLRPNTIVFNLHGKSKGIAYQSPYTVCDASNFAQVEAQVGSRVELIGRIVEVAPKRYGRNKKPYIFINFGDWTGKSVKLSIWSEALRQFSTEPNSSWNGRWVSVTGLVEPPHHGQAGKISYVSIGISIENPGQIKQLTEVEARFRLQGKKASVVTAGRNESILKGMGGKANTVPVGASPQVPKPLPQSSTHNAQVLQNMKRQMPQAVPRPTGPAHRPISHQASPNPIPTNSPKRMKMGVGFWIAIIVFSVIAWRLFF
ncbi:protein kinase family protein [Xanthomonas albilineans]|uniref:protein kinase family protein n=1 Tax=Xanthomonas albilineans TaxID=29447 RepID=UPI000A915CF4|nr:protein kinase family protein [Xanthomonas albilineans]